MTDFNVSDYHRKEFWENEKDQQKDSTKKDENATIKKKEVTDESLASTLNEEFAALDEQGVTSETQTKGKPILSNKTNASYKTMESSISAAEDPNPLLNAQPPQMNGDVGPVDNPFLTPPSENQEPVSRETVSASFMQRVKDFQPTIYQPPMPDPPIPVTDPAILNYAQLKNMTPEQAQAQIMGSHSEIFQLVVQGKVSPEEMKLLMYAYANPEAAAKLPPKLQALFQEAMGKANVQTQQHFALPPGWGITKTYVPRLQNQMNFSFDLNFEKLLNQAIQNKELTPRQYQLLKGMHYKPDASFREANPDLTKLLDKLNKQATEETAKEFGAPKDIELTPQTDGFDAEVNGKFHQLFDKHLDEVKPPLSDEEKKLAMEAYANPNAQNIPLNIRNIVEKIKYQTIGEIKAAFGLPDDWGPPESLRSKKLDPTHLQMAKKMTKNAQKMLDDVMAKAQESFPKRETQPEGILLRDFYKTISDALQRVSDNLYEILQADANVQKLIERIKTDAEMNRLEKLRAQLEEIMNYEPKLSGFLGIFIKIIIIIVVIFIGYILAPFTGGMSLQMAYVFAVDQIQSMFSGKSGFEEMFRKISEALGNGGGGVLNLLLAIILSGGNLALLIQYVFVTSHAITDLLMAMGVPEMAAQIINMVLQFIAMAFMIYVMWPLMIAETTAFIGEAIAGALAVGLEAAGMATTLATEIATWIVQYGMAVLSIVTAILQSAQNVVNIINEVKQAKLAILKGEIESEMEEIKALIALLKKIIDSILNGQSVLVEDIQRVAELQADKWNQASAITTKMAQAF